MRLGLYHHGSLVPRIKRPQKWGAGLVYSLYCKGSGHWSRIMRIEGFISNHIPPIERGTEGEREGGRVRGLDSINLQFSFSCLVGE